MSGDEYGVVTRTVTRGQMIQALQQLPVADDQPQRRRRLTLRRTPPVPHKVTCPLAEADVADLLLAHFPELEPASLKAVKQAEAIIAERDEEIAGLRQEAATAEALIETLRTELAEAGEANAELREQGKRQAATIGDLRRENATLREALASPPAAEPILDLAYLEDLTARAQRAEAGAAELRDKISEYENAIAWNTSCTACARTLDSSIAEHERADRAEQKLAAVVPALERFAAPGVITATDRRKAASDALGAAQGADGEAAP